MNNATTSDALKNINTARLFAYANESLLAGKLSQGRAALDELGRRKDNRDKLPTAESYGIPEAVRQMMQDRIDLVNSRA